MTSFKVLPSMTYRELLFTLSNLSADQLDCDVTVYDGFTEEFHPVDSICKSIENDVLDANHPVLVFCEDNKTDMSNLAEIKPPY